jgi:hypothetical protein
MTYGLVFCVLCNLDLIHCYFIKMLTTSVFQMPMACTQVLMYSEWDYFELLTCDD